MIDTEYRNLEKNDVEERAFLGQYKLPQSYHELTATDEIPDSYMTKIEDFQKKGAMSNFTNILEVISGMRDNCNNIIDTTSGLLDAEEKIDNEMRQMHGVKWNTIPS